MKYVIAALVFCSTLAAQTLTADAPSSARTADKAFWLTTAITIGANSADAFTTAKWVGNRDHCQYEAWSPWLYGSQPSAARAVGVMAAETAGVASFSYVLKKKQKRYWRLPLLLSAVGHGMGAINNFSKCR
jgi:hypothetical protein